MPDAPIEIAPYSASWQSAFEQERELLQEALGPWLAGDPVHIGSTAVPGLAAKPIIDIMGPVVSLEASSPAIEAAKRAGYVYYPYKAEQMHWFCKPSPERRTHHLHLVPVDSPLWRERLVFRDELRAKPALRDEYQALKFSLAIRYPNDREAYTEAKSPFVARVLQAAVGGKDSAA